MEFKEWEAKRNAALEVFREFLKTLPEKGFTVQQLEIIGKNAESEVNHIVSDIKEKLILTQDLTDLLK